MFRSTSNFDKLLDKATSNLRLETDWPAILQICDLIRQGDVQPKYALAAIKKKLYNANPHIAVFGLQVLESCVKNCGNLIHEEVGTKQYMEQLRDLVRTTNHDNVKNKVLELIQAWAFAFRNSPKYRAVQDTVNIMKTEGFKFPALKESDAMFSADTAPEWADADCCHRCRVAFGVVQRKHHCRACGQVFCAQCSSKTSTVPKFGFEKEVRVCEACYDSVNKSTTTPGPTTAATLKGEGDLPPEYVSSSLAQQNQAPPRKTEEELREEEEFQLALALSQSEAEHKEKEKKRTATMMSSAAASRAKQYSPPPHTENTPSHEEEVDPELARYLNRSLWNQRKATAEEKETGADRDKSASPLSQPSAPVNMPSPLTTAPKVLHDITNTGMQNQENGESDGEIEEFVAALKGQVEIFVNRMKSNSSRGRCIANDSSVQTLFMNITAMHSRLLRYIQQQDDNRVYYEGLQDKLTQVKDARAALDALREEHREKLRRQAEEAERIRQMQMAHKLEIMRKKKQDYLQYQRQLALQRIQEQERERQMRQEQQKQQYLMGTMPSYPMHYLPSVQQQGYPPGTVEGPPVHGQFGPGHMVPGNPYAAANIPGTQMGAYPHYPVAGIPGQGAPPGTHPMQGPPGAMHHMMRGPMQTHIPGQHPQGPPQQVGPHMQRAPQGMQGPQMRGMQGPPPGMQGPPPGMQGPPQGPQMQGIQGPPPGMQGPPQAPQMRGMQGPPQVPQMQGPPQVPQMQGPPRGMQGPPQAPQMQGPPQGMQGPPQAPQMQGPPQGMQGPPQAPQMQGPPQGMQGPPQAPQMQGPPQGMQGPPQAPQMQGPPQAPQMQGPPQGMQGPPQQSAPPGSPQQPPPTPQQTAELISFD